MTEEWRTEPPAADWVDTNTGLRCRARRNSVGAWCGYLALPVGHPWTEDAPDDVKVHGALNIQGRHTDTGDTLWIGFDCAHIGDFRPYESDNPPNAVYRTLAYVKQECAALAAQVVAALPWWQRVHWWMRQAPRRRT